MPRYFVFLRAINVGGRTVKMDQLREMFVSIGYPDVETFIASGNVILTSGETDPAAVEARIEEGLQAALGYEVLAIIRTRPELESIAAHQPFPSDLVEAHRKFYYVWLLKDDPSPGIQDVVEQTQTPDDFLHVNGRQVYYLARKGVGQTTINTNRLERAFGTPATNRNLNTVHRLLAKYPD